MGRDGVNAALLVEGKRLDRLPESAKGAVKKLESLPVQPLEQAKERIGRAIKHGIGDDPLKVYGNEGQMSKVVTGEAIPDYMGRLATRPEALRRYALSLLEGDQDVEVETTLRIRRRA